MSNRVDELLAALLNGETADITPQSRVETILKALVDGAGSEGLPAPQSTTEAYLHALVEKGMSGGGGGKIKITNMDNFYMGGVRLDDVPISKLDTAECTSFCSTFESCASLTSIPELDRLNTSNATDLSKMFYGCSKLTSIPELDMRKCTMCSSMFNSCTNLTSIPKLDLFWAINCSNMFKYCTALTDVRLYNVRYDLTIGSGTSYGHQLTLDSLIHIIRELINASGVNLNGSSETLTIGSANLEKLANVYVRTIEITDEMRAEDAYIDKKLPFEVCESTDEGATLITDYVLFKKWELK